LLSRWLQATTPGAAVIVVRHGQVLFEKGYGLADVTTRVPITPPTVFDIASVSKPFTATCVLMLVEQGKLRYTDSLGAFFPEFPAEAREITVRQLLSHTSGLPDYTLWWGETRRLKGTPRTADNVVAFLERQRLRFKPGRRWEYSNSNYVVLAQIVSGPRAQTEGPTAAQERVGARRRIDVPVEGEGTSGDRERAL
jgi:D-alanyl-D-alanine carboxypeptidase